MNSKILSLVSLCKRAGRLLLGFDVVKQAAEDQSARLILLASDISPKTEKEVAFIAQKTGVRVAKMPHTMDEVWMSVNKRAGVLAVTEQGFADKLYGMLSDQKED